MDHQHSEHPGTPRAADGGPGEERAEAPAPGPGRWAAWSVVGVAALPPLVLAWLGRRFLGGGVDAAYVGTPSAPGDDVGVDLGWSNRFGLLWMTFPVPEVLLAALSGLLVLAALVVAGRPAWLVPTRWGRRVGAGAAALTAVESVVCLLSLVRRAGEPERESFGGSQISYYIPSTGEFPELLGVLTLLAVTTVLPALAALVLWRAEEPGPAVVAGPRGSGPGTVAPGVPAPDVPEPDVLEPGVPGPAAVEPVVLEPVVPEPAVVEPGPGGREVPRPSAEELDAYRRPAPGNAPPRDEPGRVAP